MQTPRIRPSSPINQQSWATQGREEGTELTKGTLSQPEQYRRLQRREWDEMGGCHPPSRTLRIAEMKKSGKEKVPKLSTTARKTGVYQVVVINEVRAVRLDSHGWFFFCLMSIILNQGQPERGTRPSKRKV